jgi:hypothetical protein
MHATYPIYIIIVLFLKQYFVISTDFEPAHNTVFFIPMLPYPFTPRYHSAPQSQTPAAYVPPSF